jgi:hypothetical protein
MKKVILKVLRKFTGDPKFDPYRNKKDSEHITLVGIILLIGFFIILGFLTLGMTEL